MGHRAVKLKFDKDLAKNFSGPDHDQLPRILWPNPEVSDGDMQNGAKAPGNFFLYVICTLCLATIAAGLLVYLQLGTQRTERRVMQPVPIAATFTPSTIAIEEAAPPSNDKLSFTNESSLKDDADSWADTLSQYQQLTGSQNRVNQDKGRRAENQQLLNRLEAWMNKGAK